mmetsp:Transcript_136639/g.262564  ORF Transcript_136639/g.262564 Transcript_136639/m.262564 type:complete len:180 (+) Transcript_136639:1-540(+)
MATMIGNSDGLERVDTEQRMELKKTQGASTIPVTWCTAAVCCFWLPMCSFMAAANVLDTCEKSLGGFLRQYSLWVVLSGPVFQTLIVMGACSGNKFCFKWAEKFHSLTGFVQLTLMVWGWVTYANTSDELCYNADSPDQEHDINPRTLLFAVLLTQTILCGLTCICLPIAVVLVMKRGS